MTALAVGLLLLGALPPEASQRYRIEIAGESVGFGKLSVRCTQGRCQATWVSALRLPESGSGLLQRRIDILAEESGLARQIHVEVLSPEGRRETRAGPGPVPATLAELLLSATIEGERRCLAIRDEESGREGQACARRFGGWLEGEVLDDPIRFRADEGTLPLEVVLPAQGARFVADARAGLPPRPPRLFGSSVPAELSDGPYRFCNVNVDPEVTDAAPKRVPQTFPAGRNCREKTMRYLALATDRGIDGRHVIGVAQDGQGFVWHEWAELWVDGRWWPIDPSFRQAPARGSRFVVARFVEGVPGAQREAGRRVLACWGRSRITGGR